MENFRNNDILSKALSRLSVEPTYSAYSAAANILDRIVPEENHNPALRVAILRNFTIEPLLPMIKAEIALSGFFPVIYLGDYNAIGRDVFDLNSKLYEFQPNFVIIAQWLEVITPTLVNRFISLSPEQVKDETERVLASAEEMVASLRQKTHAPILLNNFPLPLHTTLGILDSQGKGYNNHTILNLNQDLLSRLRKWRDVYIVDYMSLMAYLGGSQGIDERYWHIAHAPIGRRTLVPLGQEYGKFFRALSGRTRKCLVLDCDNTLWGGIVGEDGLAGIKLGSTYPGSCYQAFQQEILNLHDRGVIITMCSKNNEADVLEVFRHHPETILHEDHFATWQINWNDKVTNLKNIASSLNIGIDSLVFVDDSKFECDLVREQLPEVTVLQLPTEPSAFTSILSAGAYFDSLIFTDEDRARNRMYHDEVQRKDLYEATGSLENYLVNIQMVAELGTPDNVIIPRVAQLTQKTNQFNLTTRRYSEGDIRIFCENTEVDVVYIRLRDRISDLGFIGVAIVKYAGHVAEIDTFLLSCRALGRNVEAALLAEVLTSAKSRGCISVMGKYIPTKKNTQVVDFYLRNGFKLLAETPECSAWELELDKDTYLPPSWIKVTYVQKGD